MRKQPSAGLSLCPRRTSRRAFTVSSAAVLASGCFGKFGATNALYEFNQDVSDNKWLRWLVFVALVILPVYGLFILADAVVLNTIEFFTGENPVSGGHAKLRDGHTVTTRRTAHPNVVRHEHRQHGKLVRVLHVKRLNDNHMLLLDDSLHLLARVRRERNGEYCLYDRNGKRIVSLDATQRRRISAAWSEGGSVTAALQAELSPTTRSKLATVQASLSSSA